MLLKGEHSPREYDAPLINRVIVAELLDHAQYEQAAELLNAARLSCLQNHEMIAADILTAACRICQTAAHDHSEAEMHREALEQAQAHLCLLKQKLDSVLELTGDLVVCDGIAESKADSLPIPPRQPALDCDDQPQRVSRHSWKDVLSFMKRDAVPPTLVLAKPALMLPRPAAQNPCLVLYCLGTFQVYRNNNELLENGSSRKGTLIFKYLLMNRAHPVRKEILMDLFWPDSEEQAQRNNLNVAIYSLRQMLRNGDADYSYILFQNDCYSLNPDLEIWADYEAFLESCRTAQRLEQEGKRAAAIEEYHRAEILYRGEFLPDDLYEDWLEPQRQFLQTAYLSLLNRLSGYYFEKGDYVRSIDALTKTLASDPCCEEAHCRLMRCYCRQGQSYLALRQYDLCAKSLAAELDLVPLPETTALFHLIQSDGAV